MLKELEVLRGKVIGAVCVDEDHFEVIFAFTDGTTLAVKAAGGREYTSLTIEGCGVDEFYSD